ncbi:MAG: hypothetical protein WCP79_15300 [Bacillota bacterium]
MLQAFLQRIVNGGGRIHREYALGRKRADLLIEWTTPVGLQRTVIEIKLQHRNRAATIAEGTTQICDYMDKVGERHGYLMLFDRNPAISWDEKIFDEIIENDGKKIIVMGM